MFYTNFMWYTVLFLAYYAVFFCVLLRVICMYCTLICCTGVFCFYNVYVCLKHVVLFVLCSIVSHVTQCGSVYVIHYSFVCIVHCGFMGVVQCDFVCCTVILYIIMFLCALYSVILYGVVLSMLNSMALCL